jgi:homoserine kinase
VKIHVPATSANLGPGFDSIGLALAFGLDVRVYPGDRPASGSREPPDGSPPWRVELLGEALRGLPVDRTNLIVRVARAVADRYGVTLPPCRLVVSSEIPLARGLGSSASAIVAGVALAGRLGGLELTPEEMVALAAGFEGHPDNVAAAVLGGLVITVAANGGALPPVVVRATLPPATIIVAIPGYSFLTERARAALPQTLPHREAVLASARANVLVAALLNGDWPRAGAMMRGDRFHEPYRTPLMPGVARLLDLTYEAGAYGACLSGAGPSVIAFAPPDLGTGISQALRQAVPDYEVRVTAEDRRGLVVEDGEDRQSPGERD